jgi:hypothetical protein
LVEGLKKKTTTTSMSINKSKENQRKQDQSQDIKKKEPILVNAKIYTQYE